MVLSSAILPTMQTWFLLTLATTFTINFPAGVLPDTDNEYDLP